MKITDFIEILNCNFYTGVPDSLLSPLADFLMEKYGEDGRHHVIAANEGNAVGLAAGYHLATGEVPVIYMQNSGEGNAINPMASLLNDEVYGIPAIFVIGWRGQPGVKDEPQHAFQGQITVSLMKEMGLKVFVITEATTKTEMKKVMELFKRDLEAGKQVTFVVEKGALTNPNKKEYGNKNVLGREESIKKILKSSGDDLVVSTTGKISRELFEIREGEANPTHSKDFLTVGSMGHASSIAMGIALQRPQKKVWCIDGDGAVLMHMGSLAVIGKHAPQNFIHIVLNNESHESVGGLPTAGSIADFSKIADACGYKFIKRVDSLSDLDETLKDIRSYSGPVLIEVMCSQSSRADLGRPTSTPKENKKLFMEYIQNKSD